MATRVIENDLSMAGSARAWRWLTPAMVAALFGAAALAVPAVRDIFQLEGLRWLYVLLFAFLGSCALTPVMVQISHHWNLVDIPTERKIHVQPTPRVGGIAVYAGFVGSVLMNSILPDWMTAVVVAGSLLLIVGVIDDIRELPASWKLVAQLVAAGIVIASGKVLTLFPAGVAGDTVGAHLGGHLLRDPVAPVGGHTELHTLAGHTSDEARVGDDLVDPRHRCDGPGVAEAPVVHHQAQPVDERCEVRLVVHPVTAHGLGDGVVPGGWHGDAEQLALGEQSPHDQQKLADG